MGTNIRLSKIYKMSSRNWFRVLKKVRKSLNLGINPVEYIESCYVHRNIVDNYWSDECMRSNELIVFRKFLSILSQLLKLCSKIIIYLNSQFVSSASFVSQFVSTLGIFSHWIMFFLFELMIIQVRTWNFEKLLHFFVCQFVISLKTFSSKSLHVAGSRDCFYAK